MKYHNTFLLKYIMGICIFMHHVVAVPTDSYNHHVIFHLEKAPKTKLQHYRYNNIIHKATYELKKICKLIYQNSIHDNEFYPHHRNSVFFVHFNHKFNQWTLYKPSFISYDDFTHLAKKIYRKYGLKVSSTQDSPVCLMQKEEAFSGADALTLEQFEEYKKMSDELLVSKINELKKSSSDTNKHEIQQLEKMQAMKKFFFWHLQIPTTGILEGGAFDIPDQFKPLAWNFLLWELAPKKGLGAKVAIIDTGTSAFNIQDQEFSKFYKKNINITISDDLQDYGYNLVSEHGLDPIRQIAINFANYCDHKKFNSDAFMEKLPEWIIDLIKNKNESQFEQYLSKNAKKEYRDRHGKSLNEEGRKVLKNLLYGRYGIIQNGNNSFFHIVKLGEPYNEEVLLETLPAPKLENNGFAAGHGTFTQGVVNGRLHDDHGISGLAPQAQVTMIKAFKDNGVTNKTTLQAALQRAITLKNSIVSMSLKITDEFDKIADAPLKELVDSIDYVVAASGNDGSTIAKEAYPAKFDSVAFDVGAFSYDNGNYPVCDFTQKELSIGPKFVAPGFNLFNAGLTPDQIEDSMYLFMMGTSIAVPVITGFMALVLAEFQQDFTREEILKVIYKFSIKLKDDDVWKNYIKVGTPDMRSAIFCLHVLKKLRELLKNDKQYVFTTYFDNLVQAIYTINYYVPTYYESQIGTSFMHNFSGFAQTAKTKSVEKLDDKFFKSAQHKVSDCIEATCQAIAYLINPKAYKQKGKVLPAELQTSLTNILKTKKINLFEQASVSAKDRIKAVLAPKKICLID